MTLGLTHANVGRFTDPAAVLGLARAAEAGGFDLLWTGELVVVLTTYKPRSPETPDGRCPFYVAKPIADAPTPQSGTCAEQR